MTKIKTKQKAKKFLFNLRVRIIKAPLVDSLVLEEVLSQRRQALVL